MKYLIGFGLIFMLTAYSQQRILVNPNQEVITLKQGESAERIIEENIQHPQSSDCYKLNFGLIPPQYSQWSSYFGSNNMDILAMWFIAPADGTIDSLYWLLDVIGSADAQMSIRIFRSNIYPGHGPGYPPYPPPCINWGYYNQINGTDTSITPFVYEAIDTNWISTVQNGMTTFNPLGEEIWIWDGLNYTPHLGVNGISFSQYGYELTVKKGDVFFVTMRTRCTNDTDVCLRTNAWGTRWQVSKTDEYYPSRIWKFYMKDSQASNCAGWPLNSVSKGWVARGPFENDTLYTSAFYWWFSMTLPKPRPPWFYMVDEGIEGTTFSACNNKINLMAVFCEGVPPESIDVPQIAIKWSKAKTEAGDLEFSEQPDLNFIKSDTSNLWTATFPCEPSGTTIKYRIPAVDVSGSMQYGPEQTFKIVSLSNRYYWVDTSYTYTSKSIRNTGTEVQPTDFFIPPGSSGVASDDGTAGPFDLGGPFVFFGDTVRYAWIGVNGAIALSKNESEIIDVNCNGYYIWGWDLPSLQHHGRSNNSDVNKIPPNFIAPLWTDFVLANFSSSPQTYGHIRYGSNSDSCLFIVEWDSLGVYYSYDDPPANRYDYYRANSETPFRVVLNRCDGTIEFQYDHIGWYDWYGGEPLGNLIGMQADSNSRSGSEPGYIFINRNQSPTMTKPRDNWSIKFYPGPPILVDEGWQLLSVSHQPDMGMDLSSLYPNSITDAFTYSGSYQPVNQLMNGYGYWIKFPIPGYAGVAGHEITDIIIPVNNGWNIIGTISKPVPVENIIPNPYDLAFGDFFKHDQGVGYQIVDILEPGRGYWVKVNQPGSLILSSTPPLQTFARIRIVPTSELPPSPPDENNEIAEIPKEFSLSEAYPNPFNPSTVIRYSLPANSWATLKIYNLLGQEVATLVDEFQEAGFKSVEWNAHEFASGIFFYKLSTERFVQVKKMILIR